MIKEKLLTAVASAVIAVPLAACGSGGSTSDAASTAAVAAAPASSTLPPPLTCSTSTSDNGMTASQVIAALVADQKSQDASEEQGWVSLVDGSQTSQGNDLAAAAQSLGSYSGTQIAADASQFAADAQTFLGDESSGLVAVKSSETSGCLRVLW